MGKNIKRFQTMGKNIKRFNQFSTDRLPTKNGCLIGAPDI